MTTEAKRTDTLLAPLRRFRWIYLAPALAFIALAAWAFASPIGAGPDDDYHVVSIWCSSGGSAECEPGSSPSTRDVDPALRDVACFAQQAELSASCQVDVWATSSEPNVETDRGNFVGEYPPVYYAVMHVFAGDDIQTSALAMRLFNAALFVGLAATLALLLPVSRRRTLLWGWLVTLVPLGMFLIPSNNPSGWAITGVGTAFLALLGWFETTGRRRWALAALYVLGVFMAAGARGDAAVYAVGATVCAALLAYPVSTLWPLNRGWWRTAWLPVVGLVIAVVLFSLAGQTGVVNSGFGSGTAAPAGGDDLTPALDGFALAAYNLLSLPLLWTGVWGTWALGWLDTSLPAIVPWAAVSVFVAVAFVALGRVSWRKIVAAAGVLIVLVVIPVRVLTAGGDMVGENLQPRYLLPLIVLFAFVLLTDPTRTGAFRLSRFQTLIVSGALTVAYFIALQVNIRRYVTGSDSQGVNLDGGAEWWWTGFPVGPTAVWIIGATAFAALLAVLWVELRRPVDTVAAPDALR